MDLNNNKFNLAEQDLLESLLESYYLDDDQLDYINKFYKEIFTINDNEKCLCNSKLTWEKCCKKKMDDNSTEENYISFFQTINNPKLKSKYINQINKYNKLSIKAIKESPCFINNCQNKKTAMNLYSADELMEIKNKNLKEDTNEAYLINVLDKKHIIKNIDTPFLNKENVNDNYKFYAVCKEHKKIFNNSKGKLNKNLIALISKIYKYEIVNKCYQHQVVNFYKNLQVAEQVFLIIKWRMHNNVLIALYDDLQLMADNVDNENNNFVTKLFFLPNTNNFLLNDVILPPVTPITFRPINSINNPFLKKKPLYIHTSKTQRDKEDKLLVTFTYRKEYKNLDLYFKEWISKFKNNKQIESWISGIVISLSDQMLIQKQWFEKLKDSEIKIMNLHYYYRFEHPSGSQQELSIQTFYNNLHKSINIFNKTLKIS
ncbi:hypothetical protein [Spiroplasma endosymbiont of Amphibalanus improvisus]|uniref:hypothetical protein n=1 Tax=Spiroplasma endosymbiont of Amphibalanus improvisus TaxID=3066327 RepID=UPI00313B4F72